MVSQQPEDPQNRDQVPERNPFDDPVPPATDETAADAAPEPDAPAPEPEGEPPPLVIEHGFSADLDLETPVTPPPMRLPPKRATPPADAAPTPVPEAPPAAPEGAGPGLDSALTDGLHPESAPLSTEDAAAPLPEASSPEVAQVQALAGALAKAVKAAQLYPITNPMCRQFADGLAGEMQKTFLNMDQIRLSVGKTKLFFSGETVLEQDGREESVTGRLFWSGIRELSFYVGITGEELLGFLNLYRATAQESDRGENDFVTLLWEREFEHITVIAIDDIVDLESEDDPIPEEFGTDFMNFIDVDMHDLDEDGEIAEQANEMAEQIQAKLKDESDDEALFGVSQEERDALLTEIAAEESPKMLSEIVQILGETLFLEPDEASFVELAQVLSGAMLGLIGEGRLAEAGAVLAMLRELREERLDLTPGMAAVLDASMTAVWDATRRDQLARQIDSSQPSALDALDRFVEAMPPAAIEGMGDVLGSLENPRARRRLIHALRGRARENLAPFLPFLQDPRLDLVCDVAMLLGASQNDRAVKPLKRLLTHESFNVRRSALAALSQIGRGHALDVVSEALFDRDPRIRMAAARSLGAAGRVALPVLLTVVEEADFDQRPLSEKRAFFEAMGFCGGNEVLPVVKDALERKSLFRRAQADEMRACACEALGWIGGPEAEALLREHLEEKSVIVRTAAQSGLRRIQNGDNHDFPLQEAA